MQHDQVGYDAHIMLLFIDKKNVMPFFYMNFPFENVKNDFFFYDQCFYILF